MQACADEGGVTTQYLLSMNYLCTICAANIYIYVYIYIYIICIIYYTVDDMYIYISYVT